MYDLIISDMTWSFSRLSTFEQCPYKFFLQYIMDTDKAHKFFSDYGSFVHGILEQYFRGEISRNDAVIQYLNGFSSEIQGRAPSNTIFINYFGQGLSYLKNLEKPPGKILGVEQEVTFRVGGYPFIGFVDMILQDEGGEIVVWDNKSRALKPRSSRKKPTKTDEELDEYLRQLYLYSIPLSAMYGKSPSTLVLNCYRSQQIIREPFDEAKVDEAKTWAVNLISEARQTEHWRPSLDYYYCLHLCDVGDECEYCEMAFGKRRGGG